MRKLVGFILTLIGGLGALAGVVLALAPLLRTYQANLADPLGDSASKAESTLSKDMLRGAILGGAGVAIMMVGKGMWLAAKIAEKHARTRRDASARALITPTSAHARTSSPATRETPSLSPSGRRVSER